MHSGSYPRESDASDSISEHVTQDGRIRISGGKVCVKTRMLPVSYLKKIYSVLIWAQFWEENCKSTRENADVASELPKEQAMITLQEMAVHIGFNHIQHVVK